MEINKLKTSRPAKPKISRSAHRKGFLVFGGIGLLIGLIYLILQVYDNYFSKADGLVNLYAYHNIMGLVFTGWLVSFLLYLGLSSRQKIIQNTAISLTATVVLLLLLEIVAHILIRMGVFGPITVEFRRYHINRAVADPNRKPLFWGDFSEQAGRWRAANASYSAVCCAGDSLHQHTNSMGASDQERTVRKSNANQKRVIVLGDSFMEGMLVNPQDRVSNRLEAATHQEHLNFAVNGSSPINYYLVYKSMAKRFEHDVVLVGLLPANDFQDYTPAAAYGLVDWPIYRPYWDGQYPNYTLKYSLNNVNQSISRDHQTPDKLLHTVDSVYSQLRFVDQVKASVLLNSGIYKVIQVLSVRMANTNGRMTCYEQFSEAAYIAMRYSLERLVNEAKGKKVVLLSIPIHNDIEAIRNGHKNRLDSRLQQFCNQHDILFVPLLPHFLRYKGNVSDFYVSCDGHWSKKGEQFVSDVLLTNSRYQSLLK